MNKPTKRRSETESDSPAAPMAKAHLGSASSFEDSMGAALKHARWAGPLTVIVLAILAGAISGPPLSILVLAAGTLIGVIALFWSSVRTLVGEGTLSGADAYALGAPRAEEERKRATLRALKDLEFERSVGKISEQDYRALNQKYRNEAKSLLRVLEHDAEPRRKRVEAIVDQRLVAAGLMRPEDVHAFPEGLPQWQPDAEVPQPKEKSQTDDAQPKATTTTVKCRECETPNELDSKFCKHCSARMKSSRTKKRANADEGERT